ncbi:zinc transporter [Rhynchospora pubera]|uniref:Zinc transporter n=1 Tax=Rhynchospora pubera TaxID=906938 RepID=A0AAV8GL17_9POAL|nr:zinc transporter [Rhynchospora pubera]
MSGCAASLGAASVPSRCRDGAAAEHLKLVSLGIILVASAVGVAAPVALARFLSRYPSYPSLLLLVKCFAAGVVLSTSLVHVLPDASTSLISSCHVSPDGFPFSGLVTLIGALLSLLVELSATHSHSHEISLSIDDGVAPINGSGLNPYTKVGAQEMACHKGGDLEKHGVDGEGEVIEDEEQRMVMLKQKMVSKVLEIGIVFHSVIIGVTVGMSQDVCSIRPLMIALSFHQIFEGMGLGGCIAQAGFAMTTVAYMCIMFSVTTPLGIVLGMIIFYLTGYDDSSPNALLIEGLLGSLSAGILVYMALVDLIAVDFFQNKAMSTTPGLKKKSFAALVLGSASMSILALWA